MPDMWSVLPCVKKQIHSSLCEKADTLLVASSSENVIYPVVVVRVKGVRCRALLDTVAGSSYFVSNGEAPGNEAQQN